jgi:carboxypeptidase Q
MQKRGCRVIWSAAVAVAAFAAAPAAQKSWLDAYRDPAARIVAEATSSAFAWDRLAELGDTFGHRLSGSENLELAIGWIAEQMKKDGLESVRLDPVRVPVWVRGTESAEITLPGRHPLAMLGLGNSVGTPPDGVEADLLVVKSFQELDAAAARAKGRIVLFNVPFTSYGETVQYRSDGPSREAPWPRWCGRSARRGCGRRIPVRFAMPRASRRFPERRSRRRMPIACSGCTIAGCGSG